MHLGTEALHHCCFLRLQSKQNEVVDVPQPCGPNSFETVVRLNRYSKLVNKDNLKCIKDSGSTPLSSTMNKKELKKRLLSKIKKVPSGCWEWQFSLRNGYGVLCFGEKRNLAAHRMSYIVHKGDIPKGLLICHTCDNPKCINPKHLFAGTYSDNTKDAIKKNRMVVPEGIKFKKGNRPVLALLSNHKAKALHQFINKNYPKLTLKKIAELRNVPYHTVKDMRRKKPRCYFNLF